MMDGKGLSDEEAAKIFKKAPKPTKAKGKEPFMFTRGLKLDVLGSIFKVTAVRPNGKVTMRFMGVSQEK